MMVGDECRLKVKHDYNILIVEQSHSRLN